MNAEDIKTCEHLPPFLEIPAGPIKDVHFCVGGCNTLYCFDKSHDGQHDTCNQKQ